MKPTVLIISCEHAVNTVPAKYAHLFEHKKMILETYRAYDLGANKISTQLGKALDCEVVHSKVSRLLIDCDHSVRHAKCFSKFSRMLDEADRERLIDKYYQPFHQELKSKIAGYIANQQQVLHLSIHSFTPILKGLFLNTGIGILYDSHRHAEKEVARLLHGILLQETPPYRLRLNHPFSGRHDYVLRSCRMLFGEKDYLGIKLGINQALITDKDEFHRLCKVLTHTVRELLELL